MAENRKMTLQEKVIIWGVATGIASILGIYAYAGATEERTPIRVPEAARALPWPNANAQPFIVPTSEASEVDCGTAHTFLGRLYDSSMDATGHIESVSTYEQTYNVARGSHTDADVAAIRLAVASVPHARVAICPPSPSVIYQR